MFSQLATVLLVLPFITQSVLAADCARTYTVKHGDTCRKISAMNQSPSYQLRKVNPAIDDLCYNLQEDQVICLGNTGEDCQDIHVVKPDDTCDGIAASGGIDTKMLFTNNPQINSERPLIYVGEVLCVAKSVKVSGSSTAGPGAAGLSSPPSPHSQDTGIAPGTSTSSPPPNAGNAKPGINPGSSSPKSEGAPTSPGGATGTEVGDEDLEDCDFDEVPGAAKDAQKEAPKA